ncbi:transposase [Desulfarculales bacterium]
MIGFMRVIKERLAKQARGCQTDNIWQRGFYDHTLRGGESLLEIAKYIWTNPVRSGLVASPAQDELYDFLVWPQWREEFRGAEDGWG